MEKALLEGFPILPEDADTAQVTWRNPLYYDLLLTVGPKEYRVHKVHVGHGACASAFLHRACQTLVGRIDSEAARVDLSLVLPEPLWEVVESVLDFIYTGQLDLQEKLVIKMFACAEILQIRALFNRCKDELMNSMFPSVSVAPLLLLDVEFVSESIRDAVVQHVCARILHNFHSYNAEELAVIPKEILSSIIGHNELKVMHEDAVFDVLGKITAMMPESIDLWRECRFNFLSAHRLQLASTSGGVPSEILLNALVNPVADPRQSFKDTNCLIAIEHEAVVTGKGHSKGKGGPSLLDSIKMAGPSFFFWPLILQAHIERMGGVAHLEYLCSSIGKRNIHRFMDTIDDTIDDELDVILLVVSDEESPEPELKQRLLSLIEHGIAVVLLDLRSLGPWAHAATQGRLLSDYEPFIAFHGKGKGKGKSIYPLETTAYRRPPVTSEAQREVVSALWCGMNDKFRIPGSSNGIFGANHYVIPDGLIVAEAGNNDDEESWLPICVLHPTKPVAKIKCEDVCGNDDRPVQLILNALLWLSLRSKSRQRTTRECSSCRDDYWRGHRRNENLLVSLNW